MYLDFFKLNDKPFRITCDPKYFLLCEKHKEALAMLRYGILDNRGFLLLTGEVGTGKTLLVNQLLTLLPEDTVVASLSDPDLTAIEFYRILGHSFKLASPIENKATFLIQLREYLYEAGNQKKSVALIVDEAQRLNHHLMEEIRSLSNIELPDRKLINIFLIGQPELNRVLSREENRALSQRITLRYHLEPLNRDETGDYIGHRLEVAGSSEIIFNDTAIDKIFEYTAGIPRLINILCDHALLTGSVANKLQLDADVIVQCAQELRIPTNGKSISNFRNTSKPVAPNAGSTSGGRAISRKKAGKKKDTPLFGDERMNINPKSYGRLKWAFVGIALLTVISVASALINLNDKHIPHGHSNDTPKMRQEETTGTLPASIVANEEKTYTSQNGFESDDADVKAVGPNPNMPLDRNNEQDKTLSSEAAQDRPPLQSSISSGVTDESVNHPRETDRLKGEEHPNDAAASRQNANSSPAEIDDGSDGAYLTQYNEDK